MNKQELIEKIYAYVYAYPEAKPETIGEVSVDFKRGYNEASKEITQWVEQLDEPQRPVVPQFVADWIEKSTDNLTKAEKIAYLIKSKDGDSYYFYDWFVRDGIVTQEQGEKLLAWATRQSYETLLSLYNGYEVEKEQLYIMPVPHVSFPVHYCVEDDHISFRQGNAQKFTQAELERYFPDIKQFAQPAGLEQEEAE